MKTITLQIGNSDDKLSQVGWSNFIKEIDYYLNFDCFNLVKIHFSGGSHSYAPWQNYCWVFEVEDDQLVIDAIKNQMSRLSKEKYYQDSIAWTEGITKLV